MVEVVPNSGIAIAVNRQIGPEAEAFGTATSSTVVILKSGSLSSSHLASSTSISHSSLSTARQFPMAGIGAGTGTTNGIVETISEIVGMMRENEPSSIEVYADSMFTDTTNTAVGCAAKGNAPNQRQTRIDHFHRGAACFDVVSVLSIPRVR